MIHIIGTGPGVVDLITVKGQRLLSEADMVIYAGSLASRELLGQARQNARIHDSVIMDLEQALEVMGQAERDGLTTMRPHTGDPCLYDTTREQTDGLDAREIGYDICPRVNFFCGAAAALGMEYIPSGVSQSIVIIRMAGGTPVPDRESIGKLTAHGSTMMIFLSAGMMGKLPEEPMEGGYPEGIPTIIVYKVTRPDEKVVRCTVAALRETTDRERTHKTALIVARNTMAQTGYERSKLYDPAFTTGFHVGCKDAWGKYKPGTLYVAGMGSGKERQMTGQAPEVMEQCQVITDYTVCAKLVRGLFLHKEFPTTAMTRGEERRWKAFDCCMGGEDTTMICSGNAGVYGMAGLMPELVEQYPGVNVRTVPGVTTTCVRVAVLGAPLMHGFAAISLNNRLTPLEVIWNRMETAARADFAICLCNPASKERPDYSRQIYSHILKYRPGHTVRRLVADIGREGGGTEVLVLENLKECRVDMFIIVYIGNPHTRQIDPYMATPRGYRYEGN